MHKGRTNDDVNKYSVDNGSSKVGQWYLSCGHILATVASDVYKETVI